MASPNIGNTTFVTMMYFCNKIKMMKLKLFLICCLPIICLSCKKEAKEDVSRDVLYQVSSLTSLMNGNYDGTFPISEFKKNGDFGVGTFDKINGEMTVLDGVVYQALGDGTVQIADDDEKIPFANISWFDEDFRCATSNDMSETELMEFLNAQLKQSDQENAICLARIEGSFTTMIARSELKQNEKPYKPLVEVLATDERKFSYKNVEGTIIALYCPDFMGNLNATGWHFHFISNDRKKGGHVHSFILQKNAECTLDFTNEFRMIL